MLRIWLFAQFSSFCSLSSTNFHHFPITSPWFPIISLGHKLSLPGGPNRVRLLGDLQLHPIGREVGLQGGAHQLLEPENKLEHILGPKEKVCMHIIPYHIILYYIIYYIYIHVCVCVFLCVCACVCVWLLLLYIYIYYLKNHACHIV